MYKTEFYDHPGELPQCWLELSIPGHMGLWRYIQRNPELLDALQTGSQHILEEGGRMPSRDEGY